MDENNCLKFTKPLYRSVIKFPFNWYYPNAYEREAKQKIYTLYNHLDSDNDIKTEVNFKFTILHFFLLLINCLFRYTLKPLSVLIVWKVVWATISTFLDHILHY